MEYFKPPAPPSASIMQQQQRSQRLVLGPSTLVLYRLEEGC